MRRVLENAGTEQWEHVCAEEKGAADLVVTWGCCENSAEAGEQRDCWQLAHVLIHRSGDVMGAEGSKERQEPEAGAEVHSREDEV